MARLAGSSALKPNTLERLVRLQPVWYNIRWQKAGGAGIACRGLPTDQLSQTGASLSHLSLALLHIMGWLGALRVGRETHRAVVSV